MGGLAVETQRILRAAGWWPGRQVDTAVWRERFAETGLAMHAAAADFLGEFGGLKVDQRGPGITRAREPFELDPMLVWNSEEGRFSEWAKVIERSLFPIGEFQQGRAFLGIDECAEIYLVETQVDTFGPMPAGMDNLVLGVKSRRVA